MRHLLALAVLFGLTASVSQANDAPELKAIEARYDLTQLTGNEALREKYIMELSTLRWRLVRRNLPGWQAVDAEIMRHPAPPDSDAKILSAALVGEWHSPRRDYLFRADGTWTLVDPATPVPTHGTWSIRGNQDFETIATTPEDRSTYTIILIDADNFIFADATGPYFEKRSLKGGLPLRRDDPAP